MLVYSSTIWLRCSSSVEQVLDAITPWLSKKLQTKISLSLAKQEWQKKYTQGSIHLLTAAIAFPKVISIQLSHGDSQVSGKQWVTEIGVRQENA